MLRVVFSSLFFLCCFSAVLSAQEEERASTQTVSADVLLTSDVVASAPVVNLSDPHYSIFDDKALINGYARRIANASKDVLLAMIPDDALPAYRKAAAVRVFRERFAEDSVGRDQALAERALLRQLEGNPSPFVQVEVMHTLVILDRYRYFSAMVPALIQKIDHYDLAVSELAYGSVVHINEIGNHRPREARIVFNTLRKIFFLTRKKLGGKDEADPRLKSKLELLRASIKVLGTQELKNLPREVINLM